VGLGMDERLETKFGAIILALLTLAAVVFAFLNFQQSSRFISPTDGATWIDSDRCDPRHLARGSLVRGQLSSCP